MRLDTYLFGAICAAGTALAHMEMKTPYAMKSKFDPENGPGDIDYSNTSPLDQGGSNFPCKGYHTSTFRSVATYNPGGSYSITLAGSARHNGGSCQISLSFDNGGSFQVIKSMMGGCPLVDNWSFNIPASVPSGNAILAWSWFNLVGNREMYMNCAFVTIAGGVTKNEPFYALPDLFKANIGNGCSTVEGKETVFANPGDDVQYGGKVTEGSPPFPNC